MRWISRRQSRRFTRAAIAIWEACGADLRLHEAATTEFESLQACFTRRLRPDARPIDRSPHVAVSPCDGIVMACGTIVGDTLVQAKGQWYALADLLADRALAERFDGGSYVTLRLAPDMYHRFHAPFDVRLLRTRRIAGDRWDVHASTLARVPRVYCRNERAVLELRLQRSPIAMALVPVAAILVGGIVWQPANAQYERGAELGHFEHGSTIVVLASRGATLRHDVVCGRTMRVGEPMLHLTPTSIRS